MVDWAAPALAVGGLQRELTVTCDGALESPVAGSFTMSWSTYVPGTSATKLGVAVVAPESVAVLVAGWEKKLHE
jgi:hypothetical protein